MTYHCIAAWPWLRIDALFYVDSFEIPASNLHMLINIDEFSFRHSQTGRVLQINHTAKKKRNSSRPPQLSSI